MAGLGCEDTFIWGDVLKAEKVELKCDAAYPAVLLIDPDTWQIIEANSYVTDLLGSKGDSIKQLAIGDLIPMEDCQRMKDWQVQPGTGPLDSYSLTTHISTLDGTLLCVEISLTSVLYLSGDRMIIAVVKDTSSRQAAEEQLRSSEEKWRALALNSPDHIYLLDLDLKFKYLNYAGQDVPMEQIIGQSVMIFIPPEAQADASICFENTIATGEASSYSSKFTANGETRYYESKVAAVRDKNETTALVVNSRDITHRMETEAQLRLVATAMEHAAEGMMIMDASKCIVSLNRAFAVITQFEEEEVLGRSTFFLRSKHHSEAFYAQLWKTVDKEGIWQGEIWSRRKNGDIYPCWASLSIVRAPKGEVLNYVVVFSDISVIKQSQERIHFLAYHDALTELPNRSLFSNCLSDAIKRADKLQTRVAVFFVDLDRFKLINDTLGHSVGDAVIVQAAQRLKEVVGEEGTVARLAGDEFIVAMEGVINSDDIRLLAEKLINAFQAPFIINQHELHVTISMGASIYPDDATESEDLLKNSDMAMYLSKETGRNSFHFYTPELRLQTNERMALQTDLRKEK